MTKKEIWKKVKSKIKYKDLEESYAPLILTNYQPHSILNFMNDSTFQYIADRVMEIPACR